MESMYRFFGRREVDPKKPCDSFFLQMALLKVLGLWAPDTENQKIQILYTIWSYFYRGFFLYTYTFMQIMFFKDVEDIASAAEGFFLLLTQIALIYKVEMFYINRHRIKACEKLLRSPLFLPKDEEEDAVIKESMVLAFAFGMAFLVPAEMTCSSWGVGPFFQEKLRLPIAAWYPFSIENPFVFALTYFYQVYGVFMSSWFNVATDTFASAIMSHANGQVRRLGIQLKNIGYSNIEKNLKKDIIMVKNQTAFLKDEDEKMMEINKKIKEVKDKHGENYGEVVRCVIFHDEILKFCAEIQDIFRGPIFAQMIASTVIICMTLLVLINQMNNLGAAAGALAYLAAMVTQIFLFCWIGNEVIYSSYQLTQHAYFSNFQVFDQKTKKALLIFMQRTKKDIIIAAGTVFEVHLSLPTFMGIMKSSYSYFAVLNTMQNK